MTPWVGGVHSIAYVEQVLFGVCPERVRVARDPVLPAVQALCSAACRALGRRGLSIGESVATIASSAPPAISYDFEAVQLETRRIAVRYPSGPANLLFCSRNSLSTRS